MFIETIRGDEPEVLPATRRNHGGGDKTFNVCPLLGRGQL